MAYFIELDEENVSFVYPISTDPASNFSSLGESEHQEVSKWVHQGILVAFVDHVLTKYFSNFELEFFDNDLYVMVKRIAVGSDLDLCRQQIQISINSVLAQKSFSRDQSTWSFCLK